MFLRQIFDPALAQYAYLVGCQRTGEALIIDPERDVDRYLNISRENDLRITAVAETHIHADFVSGAQELAANPKIRLFLSGEGGDDWSYRWPGTRSNVTYLKHGDHFQVGNIIVEAIHTPGHTPEHISFLITDQGGGADEPIALATGDFLFVGDVGRPDLLETAAGAKGVMEPSARRLRESLAGRLSGLPEYLQILPAHGAGSACGKSLGAVPTSTLGYEQRFNRAFKLALSDAEGFVKDILSGQPDPPLYFARMKRVNRDGITVTGGVSLPPHLSPEGVSRETNRQGVRILDLRQDREEFDDGHLRHAIHAPFPTPFFLTSAGSYVSEDEEIVLIVACKDDVEEAVRQLYRIGLDRVIGWAAAGELTAAGLAIEKVPHIQFDTWNPHGLQSDETILDVRTTSEFQSGHIEGAISIPYTRLRERLSGLPRGKRFCVHCGTGKRASLAASFLRAEGFNAVHVDGVCAECEAIAREKSMTH